MTTETMAKPFEFNGNYHDFEQVAPFRAAYDARRAELDAAGQYPYNDSFRGFLGLPEGTTRENEDSAIYLLQRQRHLEDDQAQLRDFIDGGGVPLDLAPLNVYGDLAQFGKYVGGTGFGIVHDVRLVGRDRNRPLFKGRRQRGTRTLSDGGSFYFRPAK